MGAIARVLILPAYIPWLAVTMLQVQLSGPGAPTPVVGHAFLLLKVGAALLPYVVADAILGRARARRALERRGPAAHS